MQELADVLCQARRIHVFGIGGCSTVFSQEMQNRLMRFGLPITACSDAVVMKMTAAILGPQDLVRRVYQANRAQLAGRVRQGDLL